MVEALRWPKTARGVTLLEGAAIEEGRGDLYHLPP
jgi:hypothetical protein